MNERKSGAFHVSEVAHRICDHPAMNDQNKASLDALMIAASATTNDAKNPDLALGHFLDVVQAELDKRLNGQKQDRDDRQRVCNA